MHAPGPLCVALLLVACRAEPPTPKRTEPWAAAPPSAAAVRAATQFRIEPRCEASISLNGPQRQARGRLRVARGELSIDLDDLVRSRGHVALDVGSLAMDDTKEHRDRRDAGPTEASASPTRRYAAQALDWLDLG